MKKILSALLCLATTASASPTNTESLPDIRIKILTSQGPLEAILFPSKAPKTVANFLNLARRGYYNGLSFHRVIPNFMVQGGDPTGTGSGGPGYRFPDECHPELLHDKPGVLSMANSGPNTNGSQFFITHVPTPWLDGKHTVFGTITEGQRTVNAIEKGDKIEAVEILDSPEELFTAEKELINSWNQKLEPGPV